MYWDIVFITISIVGSRYPMSFDRYGFAYYKVANVKGSWYYGNETCKQMALKYSSPEANFCFRGYMAEARSFDELRFLKRVLRGMLTIIN